jgi:hypothetical protein
MFGADLDMQGEDEVNVKMESDLGSEEERCEGVKGEEGLCSEEKDVDINEEDMDIKGEVSVEVRCDVVWSEC